MKKLLYTTIVLIITVSLQGCNSSQVNSPENIINNSANKPNVNEKVATTADKEINSPNTPNSEKVIKVTSEQALKLMVKFTELPNLYYLETDAKTGFYTFVYSNPIDGKGTSTFWWVNPYNGDVYNMVETVIYNLLDSPSDKAKMSSDKASKEVNTDKLKSKSPVHIESKSDSMIVVNNYSCKDIQLILNEYFEVHQTVGFQYIMTEDNFAYFDLPSTVNGFGHPLIEVLVSTKDGRVKYTDSGNRVQDKTIGYIDSLIKTKGSPTDINQEIQAQPIQMQKSDTGEKNKDLNQFFFSNISTQKQYVYKGTVWGDNIIQGDKPEDMDKEGGVFVIARLNVTEVAKLNKGNIYELSFCINGAKNNTEMKSEKVYFWVVEDRIYHFSPPKGFDYKGFVENGSINVLGCIKELEKNEQLPSDDKNLLRCINENMKFADGVWETDISLMNNKCSYSSNNPRDFSYTKLVWELGEGLTSYSRGQGARKAGVSLTLAESK